MFNPTGFVQLFSKDKKSEAEERKITLNE